MPKQPPTEKRDEFEVVVAQKSHHHHDDQESKEQQQQQQQQQQQRRGEEGVVTTIEEISPHQVWLDLVNSDNVRLPQALKLFEEHGITCIESACIFLTDEIAATVRNSIKRFHQKRFDVLIELIKNCKSEKEQHECKVSEEELPALDAEMVKREIEALKKQISIIDSILVGDVDERKMYSTEFTDGAKEKLKVSKEVHLQCLEDLNAAHGVHGYFRQCIMSHSAAVPRKQTQRKSKELRVRFYLPHADPDTTSDRELALALQEQDDLECKREQERTRLAALSSKPSEQPGWGGWTCSLCKGLNSVMAISCVACKEWRYASNPRPPTKPYNSAMHSPVSGRIDTSRHEQRPVDEWRFASNRKPQLNRYESPTHCRSRTTMSATSFNTSGKGNKGYNEETVKRTERFESPSRVTATRECSVESVAAAVESTSQAGCEEVADAKNPLERRSTYATKTAMVLQYSPDVYASSSSAAAMTRGRGREQERVSGGLACDGRRENGTRPLNYASSRDSIGDVRANSSARLSTPEQAVASTSLVQTFVSNVTGFVTSACDMWAPPLNNYRRRVVQEAAVELRHYNYTIASTSNYPRADSKGMSPRDSHTRNVERGAGQQASRPPWKH